MQETPSLPPGFKFHPTREELVGFYLVNKIMDYPVPYDGSFVKYCDLYGEEEPWEIWERFEGGDEDMFFFTNLKRKTPNSSRVDRRVGCPQGQGTWHGEDTGSQFPVQIKDGAYQARCITGYKKRFNYRNPGSEHHAKWIMHEYSCSLSKDTVLCLLRRNGTAAGSKVKTDSSKKRKLSEFQEDANIEVEPDSKQLKIDREPHTNENHQMGVVCINDNESAPVATTEGDDDDIMEILDNFTFDGCHSDINAFESEAASLAVPETGILEHHEGLLQLNNANSNMACSQAESNFQLLCPQAEVVGPCSWGNEKQLLIEEQPVNLISHGDIGAENGITIDHTTLKKNGYEAHETDVFSNSDKHLPIEEQPANLNSTDHMALQKNGHEADVGGITDRGDLTAMVDENGCNEMTDNTLCSCSWADSFAQFLLQDSPAGLCQEDEVQMISNRFYMECEGIVL